MLRTELSHIIFLKKELLAKLSKFTKCQPFSLKMVLSCLFEFKWLSICEFAQLCKQFFNSQDEKKSWYLTSNGNKIKHLSHVNRFTIQELRANGDHLEHCILLCLLQEDWVLSQRFHQQIQIQLLLGTGSHQ